MQSIGQKRKAASSTRPPLPVVNRKTGLGMMGMPSSSAEFAEDDDDDDTRSTCSSASTPMTLAKMPRVRVGNRHLQMHKELVEMDDSTELFQSGDFSALRRKLESEGFLFVRGVVPPEVVLKARMKMLGHLHNKGAIRDNTTWEEGFIEYQAKWEQKQKELAANNGGRKKKARSSTATTATTTNSKKMIPGWTVDAESGGIIGGREPDEAVEGWYNIGNSKELTDVYNGAALQSFYEQLFAQDEEYSSRPHLAQRGAKPYTTLPNCTWLRAKGPGEVTAEHADYYYFYKNTSIFSDFFTSTTEVQEQKKKLQQGKKEMTLEEKETCQICHDPKDPESTLICDLCNHGYHMSCLKPTISELPPADQEWHCYDCCNQPLNYWTCWMALGDIGGLDGRLALIPRSHRVSGYEDPAREDLLPSGYTKTFEQNSVWQTPTEIHMGDIILFNIKTIHAATRNGGEKFRLSLDTRVTTCKGKKYMEMNKLTSLDAPVEVPVKAKAKGRAAAKPETLHGFFPTTKKVQKIVA